MGYMAGSCKTRERKRKERKGVGHWSLALSDLWRWGKCGMGEAIGLPPTMKPAIPFALFIMLYAVAIYMTGNTTVWKYTCADSSQIAGGVWHRGSR
jgi:hypothetical protein